MAAPGRVMSVLALFALLTAGLAAQSTTTVSGVVTTRADGLSVPGAVVSIVGTGVTVTTDAEGKYRLDVPPAFARAGKVQIKVEGLGLPANIVDVEIRPDTPATADVGLSLGFEEQITVGSRMVGAEAQKAVPVDVITQDQIASSGYAETTQVIQAIAPSFNFPRPTITDGTDTVRPATLRGLGPDQVLVLINGERRHQSALVHLNGSIGRGSTGVDLNAIPVSAIERIEILRDGAAAQYGSDAIAGVINIVLKRGVSGPAVTSKFGLSSGSFTGNSCSSAGQTCQPGNKIDFSDGGLFDAGGSWGIGLGKGSLTVAAEYRHHNRTNRASFDPRDQIVAGDAGNNAVAQPNHRLRVHHGHQIAGVGIAPAASPIVPAASPPSAHRSSPASVRATRWTNRATASRRISMSKGTFSSGCGSASPAAPSTTATSAAPSRAS